MAVLPFRLLSNADREKVLNSIHAISKDWSSDWFSSSLEIKLSIKNEEDVNWSSREWFAMGHKPDAWLVWSMEPAACKEIVAAMFDSALGISSKTTPLVKALVQECVSNLFQRITSLLGTSFNSQVYSGDLQVLRSEYGSGALQIELTGDMFKQQLILGGDVVDYLCQSNSDKPTIAANLKLVGREKTLGKHVTRLQVNVGKAEITLQDLAGMQVGDVIRLQAGIKDSFLVQCPDNHQPVAKAHLGVIGKHKAIQLIE